MYIKFSEVNIESHMIDRSQGISDRTFMTNRAMSQKLINIEKEEFYSSVTVDLSYNSSEFEAFAQNVEN